MQRCIFLFWLRVQSLEQLRTFNSVLGGKLLAVVFEVQHDLGSLLNTAGLCDLKYSGAEVSKDRESQRIMCFSTGAVSNQKAFCLWSHPHPVLFLSYPSDDHLYPGAPGSANLE